MSKFLKLTVDFLSYNATTSTNDASDAERIKQTVEEPSISAMSRSNPLTIANTTVDQSIGLPGSTINYLLIFVDQVVSVKLNGGSAQLLRPISAGKKTPALLIRGDITSLTVSNSSGAAANLDVIAAKI